MTNERLTCPLLQLVGQLQSSPALTVPQLEVTVAVQEHHGDVVVAAQHGQVQGGVTLLEIMVKTKIIVCIAQVRSLHKSLSSQSWT